MNLSFTMNMTAHFVAIALFIQAVEFYILSRKKSVLTIWSYENLKYDLEAGLPLPSKFVQWIFADPMLKSVSSLQICLSILAFIHPHAILFIFLLLCHLWFCIRFRGTFNGGSDMMTFVLLTGLLISYLVTSEKGQNLGLIYISIHTLYSYFKAGLAKITKKEWRTGAALPIFLSRSLFLDTQKLAAWLQLKPILSFVICWAVIVFELGIVLLFFVPRMIFPYFFLACVFHALVFVSYGLNRFFWVWLAAWPSLFYAITLATAA